MTDFHTHILPGIDDGSASPEESVCMLRMEAEQGVTRVVATPHFYARHDKPEHFLQRREAAEQQLRRLLQQQPGLPELYIGAEVSFFRGISDAELLPQLTIRGTDCILLEMPPAPWPEAVYRELDQIWIKRGITPVIAHLDRYIGPFKTFQLPQRLAQLPVLVQANAEFFLQRRTAAMAMRLLAAGMIQLLGSDCHNTDSRKPDMGEAWQRIRKKLGEAALDRISTCERSILER